MDYKKVSIALGFVVAFLVGCVIDHQPRDPSPIDEHDAPARPGSRVDRASSPTPADGNPV